MTQGLALAVELMCNQGSYRGGHTMAHRSNHNPTALLLCILAYLAVVAGVAVAVLT